MINKIDLIVYTHEIERKAVSTKYKWNTLWWRKSKCMRIYSLKVVMASHLEIWSSNLILELV